MADKRIKQKKRGSVIIRAINRFTAFIYSFFAGGRIGDMLSSDNTLCKRSYLANRFIKESGGKRRTFLQYSDAVMEHGIVSRAIVSFRIFMASVELCVYGMFFLFYGLSSCVSVLIPTITDGFSAVNEYELVTAAVVILCSLPICFSSRSATEALLESRMMRKVVLDILCIPEEKLKIQRSYGTSAYMFISALIGMALGALSYFIDPIIVPMIFLCLISILAIFSSPETGVLMTLALTPYMQYMAHSKLVLLIAVFLTAVSYLCKVFQRRRKISLSPEITMVLLFCAFILSAGSFSVGGIRTFFDSLFTVMIILGGFFLVYNLINTEKLLSACLKTLAASLFALCMIGTWESVFYGISNRIIDSVSPNISLLPEENVLQIADKSIVFGMFIVLIFPILLAYLAKKRSVKSTSFMLIFAMMAISAAWMCSNFEIMVALVLELLVFGFLYSNKTMTAVIVASIPIGILILLYPYAVGDWGMHNIISEAKDYMPASVSGSEIHWVVVNDVSEMLIDGNFFGIGAGDHAFGVLFPAYASDAAIGAENPMSMWLQIICWSGIFGLVAFLLFFIFLIKRSLGFIRDPFNKDLRGKTTALFCGVTVSILFGFVYCIWNDERILYLFWVCVGLLMSYIRLGRDREAVRWSEFKSSADEKDIEIEFYN